MRRTDATPFVDLISTVTNFPKCAGCGKEARYLCPLCYLPFCVLRGCPDSDEYHPASVLLRQVASE